MATHTNLFLWFNLVSRSQTDFSLWGRGKGSGNIVSTDWCQQSPLISVSVNNNDDAVVIITYRVSCLVTMRVRPDVPASRIKSVQLTSLKSLCVNGQ